MIKRILLLFLILSFSSLGCERNDMAKKSRLLMGTVATIKIPISGKESTAPIMDKAFSKIEETQNLMNRFDDGSEAASINRLRKGQKIKLNPHTLFVIKKALYLNRITDGAFDITVSPLVELWGFYKNKKKRMPDEEEIRAALLKVGSQNLILDDDGYLSFAKDEMELDLSAIAKGYSVDEAIKVLRQNGVRNGLVEAGGDMYCLGSGPDEEGWHIGIRHPRKDGLIGTLSVKDKAVATSGDYQKFFLYDAKRYSHIIDPRNGRPVADSPMSVTVIAPDCITADGLATALSVMGPLKGIRLAEELKDIEAMAVSQGPDGSLIINATAGFKDSYDDY